MGEVIINIVAALRQQNPRAPAGDIQLYADALDEYRLAQANIAEHGAVVFHPRTGAPISNPYCVIRDKAAERIAKLKLKAEGIW